MFLFLVTGCTNNLKCTTTNVVNGSFSNSEDLTIIVKKSGIDSIVRKVSITYTDSYLKDYGVTIDELKNMEEENYKNNYKDGEYEITKKNNSIIIKTTCNEKCVKSNEELLGKDINTIKTSIKDGKLGSIYICK